MSGGARARKSAARWFFLALLATFAASEVRPHPAAGQDQAVSVEVVNALTGEPMAQLGVAAARRVGSSFEWVASRETDSGGRVTFQLPGIESGVPHVLFAQPYNGGVAQSDDITAPGSVRFAVGQLPVTVLAGGTGEPLRDARVVLVEKFTDGSFKYVSEGMTDLDGMIMFDPPGLAGGARVFVLLAVSPWDATLRQSNEISAIGGFTFVVGNAPLKVTLLDAISLAPLPGRGITAFERMPDGTFEPARSSATDADGQAVFDLEGLGGGRVYVLRVVSFNGSLAESEELIAPGNYFFQVGSLSVTVVDGHRTPLPGTEVYALEQLADGALAYQRSGVTDESGVIRFDLPRLDVHHPHVLAAHSPADGSLKFSDAITAAGEIVFQVGNRPLLVTLVNGVSGEVVPDVLIAAFERLSDGSERGVASRTTDTQGRAVFDLDGFGQGRVYFLRTEPYNAGVVISEDLTAGGEFEFRVGTLEVTVVSGADGGILSVADVIAWERLADESLVPARQARTTADGIIRFDLPGLGNGRNYVLGALSPVDGSLKRSDTLTATGSYRFVVGNQPLVVTLVNGVTERPLIARQIAVAEESDDGTLRWIAGAATDGSGTVAFDLDNLADGRSHFLFTEPYNAGPTRGGPITAPGNVTFRVGTVPVTLIDADSEQPLPGKRLVALHKSPDGALGFAGEGLTDGTGTVHFDLAGISRTIDRGEGAANAAAEESETVYVFAAFSPFGQNKQYFSGVVDREGAVELRFSSGSDSPIDLRPPVIAIASPEDGATVPASGFTVHGTAVDNDRVSETRVAVSSAAGNSEAAVSYDAGTGLWSADIAPEALTSGEIVTVTASAVDPMLNRSSTSITLLALVDTAPPHISITSHGDGDAVESSGFLLSGAVTDDIEVASLKATVEDPLHGRTVDGMSLSVAKDGRWTLPVLDEQISVGERITVTLVATDAVDKNSTALIQLRVEPADLQPIHLVNRVTFGATSQLIEEVNALGADAFLARQLDPDSIDDSAFDAMLTNVQVTTELELQRYVLLHAIYSKRQLREVMTQFWDNHFNTYLTKHGVVAYELAENDLFRQEALGYFRDLLEASAKSPAMLVYLDQARSKRGSPNENYARELMELHTLGVDGGFTPTDVVEVARALTGWGVQGGQFFFDASEHDTGEKVVLGHAIAAGGGVEDGEAVLDILAEHPSTATFLCSKLSRLLVTDSPPAALVARCASSFVDSGGHIASVLRTVLESPEFADARYFRDKVKTPLELVVGVLRNLSVASDANDLSAPLTLMGMRLFANPVPTGWPDRGEDWVHSNALLQRINFVQQIARGWNPAATLALRDFFVARDRTTAEGIVGDLLQLLFHHDFTPLEYHLALDKLTRGGTDVFDLDAPDAEARLAPMLATVLSFPSYQYR